MPGLPEQFIVPQPPRGDIPPAVRDWLNAMGLGITNQWRPLIYTLNSLLRSDTAANRTATPDLNEILFFASDTFALSVASGGSWRTVDHGGLGGLGDDDHTNYVLRSILTTKGDLFVRDTTGVQRIAVGANTHVLTADSAQSLGVKWAAGAGGGTTQDRDVITAEVVNTVTETTVYSYPVPGNTLSTNKMLRLTLFMDYLNSSGGASVFTVRVKYGATTIFDTGGRSFVSGVTRRALPLEVKLSANNATNAQVSSGFIMDGDVNTVTGNAQGAGALEVMVANHNAIAIDSTANADLVVTFQHNIAATTISAKLYVAQLELV